MRRSLWSIWNDGESLRTAKVAFIYPASIARMFTVILLLRNPEVALAFSRILETSSLYQCLRSLNVGAKWLECEGPLIHENARKSESRSINGRKDRDK